MGVRGLQSFLESHCGAACYSVNIGKVAEEYQKRTGKTPLIVIDGMSCLRKLYGKLNWICGGQWKGYIDHYTNFVRSLQSHGAKLVFFFDGTTPDVLGCDVYTCLEECDKEVAEFAKANNAMAILGQDSDYTIYNTAHYYFSINHLNLETLETIVYDRLALSRVLNINVEQLPVLSCLIGNDVIHQDRLAGFHKYVLRDAHGHHHKHHGKPQPEILIPKVGNFIHNQPPMDQLMNQLPQLARSVFRDETMVPLLMEGIKMYQLDLTAPEKYRQIPEEELKTFDILDLVKARHFQSELGRHLYTILRGEAYESSTTLEDYTSNLPSGAIVFQPLRAKVCMILQKTLGEGISKVPEWCMYSGNTLKDADYIEPVELSEGSPSLAELWGGQEELKWKTFLEVLHPSLHETNIRNLPSHLIFPVSVIFYMQCSQPKPIFKEWEVTAIVASFLSPLREDLNKIRAISLPRFDARAVHLAAIFMKGLVNFYLLLATCDFPIHRTNAVPWKFWDGKVFQHMYLKAKAGSKVEDLCEHRDDLLKLHFEIKQLIVSHTPVNTHVKANQSSKSPELNSSSPHASPKRPCSRTHSPRSDPPSTLSIENVGMSHNSPRHGRNSQKSPKSSAPVSPSFKDNASKTAVQ